MDHFVSPHQSHLHSLKTLNQIYQYDTFLDSIKNIADFGCGSGLDTNWWATLSTRDDPPQPRNYNVASVDIVDKVDPKVKELKNVKLITNDFEKEGVVGNSIDLLWCHDAFQYVVNPLQTLCNWNKMMVKDGMLIIIMPQYAGYVNNKVHFRIYNGTLYPHNIVNLMYMLAVCGFDCNDAFFKVEVHDYVPWIHAAVYKAGDPIDPKTSLYQLADMQLLNPSATKSLDANGYIRQEDLITSWFDKDWHRHVL